MTGDITVDIDEELRSLGADVMLGTPEMELTWIQAIRDEFNWLPRPELEVKILKSLTMLKVDMSIYRVDLSIDNLGVDDFRYLDAIRYELCLLKKILFIVPGCPQNHEETQKLAKYLYRENPPYVDPETKKEWSWRQRSGLYVHHGECNKPIFQRGLYEMYNKIREIKYIAWLCPQQSDRFQPLCRFAMDQIGQCFLTIEQLLRPPTEPGIEPLPYPSTSYDDSIVFRQGQLEIQAQAFPTKFLGCYTERKMIAESYADASECREFFCKELDPSRFPPEWVNNGSNHYECIAHYYGIREPARAPLKFFISGSIRHDICIPVAYAYCHNENCFDPDHHVIVSDKDLMTYVECPGGLHCRHRQQCPWPGSTFVRYQ